MIYTHIPYTPKEYGTNLGYAYNKFMEMLPSDDDWGCFLDHDAMFTTNNWYNQLNDIIIKYKDVGAFGCRTNRLKKTYQLVGNIDPYNHDIIYHRKIGNFLQSNYYDDVQHITKKLRPKGFSGVFILIKKSVWKKINGFKTTGFLGVDDDLRHRLNIYDIPLYIMNGVYVYHWYRADNPYLHARMHIKKFWNKYFHENSQEFDLNKIFLPKQSREF